MVLPTPHADGYGDLAPFLEPLEALHTRLLREYAYLHLPNADTWHGESATTTHTGPLITKKEMEDIMSFWNRGGPAAPLQHRHDAHELQTSDNRREHKDDHQRNARRIAEGVRTSVEAHGERRELEGDIGDVKQALLTLRRAVFGQSVIDAGAVHKYGTLVSIVNKHKDAIRDLAQETADVALGCTTERQALLKKYHDLDAATANNLTRLEDVLDTHARMISELDRVARAQGEKNKALEAQCADLRRRVGHTETANGARVTDICDLLVKVAALEGKKNPFVLGGPSECEIEAVVEEITEDTVAHQLFTFIIDTLDCNDISRTHNVVAPDAGAACKKVNQFIAANCSCEPHITKVVREDQVDIVGHAG